jgi:(p)ppGpp synthase/HD superfamily hydrolase
MDDLGKMIALAATAHYEQKDKSGKPYILHCLAVMRILNSDDDTLNCIAVGHDLLEDTNVTHTWLRDCFSDRVYKAIVALTKTKGQSYEDYQLQVMGNIDAVKVKIADLTHNSDITRLKGLTDKDFERMKKYHAFYTKLKDYLNDYRFDD